MILPLERPQPLPRLLNKYHTDITSVPGIADLVLGDPDTPDVEICVLPILWDADSTSLAIIITEPSGEQMPSMSAYCNCFRCFRRSPAGRRARARGRGGRRCRYRGRSDAAADVEEETDAEQQLRHDLEMAAQMAGGDEEQHMGMDVEEDLSLFYFAIRAIEQVEVWPEGLPDVGVVEAIEGVVEATEHLHAEE